MFALVYGVSHMLNSGDVWRPLSSIHPNTTEDPQQKEQERQNISRIDASYSFPVLSIYVEY